MALEQSYMSESLDLLARIEAYSSNIRANVEAMTMMGEAQQNTMERIAKSSEATSDQTKAPTKVDVKSLGEIGMSVKQFADGIIDAFPKIKKVRKQMQPMAMAIGEFVVTLSDAVGDKEKVEAAEKGANVINTLAGSLLKFVGQIALATPLLILIMPMIPIAALIMGMFIRLLGLFAGKAAEQAETGAQAMESIGKGILDFAWKTALALPLLLLAVPALLIFEAAALLVVLIARTIAMADKQIDRAGNLLREMGIAMLVFTAALALSLLIMSTIGMDDMGSLGMLFLMMAGTALAFYIVGKFDKSINKGAIAVIIMSIAILTFALLLKLATMLLPPFMDVLMLSVSVIALGLVFYLAGTFWQQIALGALAFMLVGASLLILSLGLVSISAVVKTNPQMLWQLPVLIIGLGAAFALAGIPVAAAFIALGAAVMGLAGLALISIGLGIQAIMKPLKGADESTLENIELALRSIINGFGKGFSDLSMTEALTLPLKIPMVALMGVSLAMLGVGLGKWMKVAGNWDEEDTDRLSYVISGISKAFATAGSSAGMSKLFGFNVGKNDTERGIESTMRMGKNLNRLAKGIAAWQKLELSQEAMQQINDNIMRVLNTIPGAFAAIGARERKSKGELSFLGMSFVNPFMSSDVELGIEATEDIGGVLKDLSDGVAAWKKADLTEEDVRMISNNVSRILNTIPSVFASIGMREKGSRQKLNFFGMEFMNPFSSGDIEAGIDSVENLGTTLKDLADGVAAWKPNGKMSLTEEDIKAIQTNVAAVLNSIPEVFAAIGNKEKDSRGWFGWGEGDIEAGINTIMPMGKALKSVIDGIKVFKPGGKESMTPKELRQAQDSIASVMKTIPYAFAKAGRIIEANQDQIDLGIEYARKFSKPISKLSAALISAGAAEVKTFEQASSAGGLGESTGGLQWAARRFGSGFYSLIRWISLAFKDNTIQEKHIKSMTKLVKPLKNLADILPNLNREFQIQLKFLSDLDGKTVKLFAQWANAMEKLSKTNLKKVQESGLFSRLVTKGAAEEQEGAAPSTAMTPKKGQGSGAPPPPKKEDVAVPKGTNAGDAQMIKLLTQMVNSMNALAATMATQNKTLTEIKTALQSKKGGYNPAE